MVLEFTVSVVSALINAATIFGSASEGLSHIVLVAITFPLALGIVLVGLLNPDKDRTFKLEANGINDDHFDRHRESFAEHDLARARGLRLS